jgi:demethylmenaquinone methyltransferase/2-methoxy-6-polyprenyl-1,4-benzoquinol methylase
MSNTVTPYQNEQTTKKEQVADMFNNISKTYDFLNHFMSLGIDIIWRKKAINQLKADQPKLILDVATGTGDFAFEALKILKPEKIIGVDISQGMLDMAVQKIAKRGLGEQFEVRLGDSERLLFDADTFDAVTVAYGVRNFENLPDGEAFVALMDKVGFKNTKHKPLAFGICSIYTGVK